jgi:hypothetical protein
LAIFDTLTVIAHFQILDADPQVFAIISNDQRRFGVFRFYSIF